MTGATNHTGALGEGQEVAGCPRWSPHYQLAWPVVLLLALPVGGVYANLAMCVGLRQDKGGWASHMAYPYLLSLACGDILNCMLVMPTAVINAFLGQCSPDT